MTILKVPFILENLLCNYLEQGPRWDSCNKAFRHVENSFIQRFLIIHPRFVFIVQGSLFVVQKKQTLDE